MCKLKSYRELRKTHKRCLDSLLVSWTLFYYRPINILSISILNPISPQRLSLRKKFPQLLIYIFAEKITLYPQKRTQGDNEVKYRISHSAVPYFTTWNLVTLPRRTVITNIRPAGRMWSPDCGSRSQCVAERRTRVSELFRLHSIPPYPYVSFKICYNNSENFCFFVLYVVERNYCCSAKKLNFQ